MCKRWVGLIKQHLKCDEISMKKRVDTIQEQIGFKIFKTFKKMEKNNED